MKIKAEIEITLTKINEVDCVGTHYLGEIKANYEKIVKAFGKPVLYPYGKGDKIQAMWKGKINGLIFTIYDYKEYETSNFFKYAKKARSHSWR